MTKSLIIVSGCNAAGKSTFIRSRISQFENYCIIMPDVYKSGTYSKFQDAIDRNENIVLENILRDDEVFLMLKKAKKQKYTITLFQLFIKPPSFSMERVSFWSINENGSNIDKFAVQMNFETNFKNVANAYYLFDNAYFLHTGTINENQLIVKFENGILVEYYNNELSWIQYFSDYVISIGKNLDNFERIKHNKDFNSKSVSNSSLPKNNS